MARHTAGASQRAAAGLAELIEHVGRRIHGAGFVGGLIPAQWSALRFLGRTNPSARTLSGFIRFHSVSSGSAAQTLRALRQKGLIAQRVSDSDRRVKYYELTEKGRKTLGEDPLNAVVSAIQTLTAQEVGETAVALQAILRASFLTE